MEPIGKVVVLEDTDKDGVMDKRTVFADGLVLARSLKVLDGVLVGEPPNAWLMRDTNGDLKMDTKESITDLYGRREARVEQNANDFFWAMDNWMHTADGDIYLRLKDGQVRGSQDPHPRRMGRDPGRRRPDLPEHERVVCARRLRATPYFLRNPALVRAAAATKRSATRTTRSMVWPVRPNPGTNRAYQFGIDRPDGTLARFTAVCAPLIYRGDRPAVRSTATCSSPSRPRTW